MNQSTTRIIDQMAALGQESRFRVFQYLMQEGPDGVAAGHLSDALEIRPSTLSTHLGILSRADLVVSRREGRTLFYSANISGVSTLIEGLVADCCHGHPELCRSLPASSTLDCL